MMGELEQPKTRREPAEQTVARFLGMLVFAGGIALLGMTFLLAFNAFHKPDMIIAHNDLSVKTLDVYLIVLLKLVLLFAMGYIGSLIAARGAQLFFSARRIERHAAAGD